MLTDDQFSFIADAVEGMELNAIWNYFDEPYGSKWLSHPYASFEDRREAFLWVVKRLLEEHRIKLLTLWAGPPLLGNIDEQIQRMRDAFPKDDAAMNNGFWFYDENKCPAGSAWQADDS